ncbi:hypothetical protein IE81DRAFT_321962 [Ceraceosorus guamensis]|uniref:Uncharacterized protein n=1 Tax=Ceraceosorus guamensis TaxID=1522189 RepID=A0A316W2S0_9BASI|nr:hypothetical protein IE81DRAFT_321962 [Ceraceosorus guamensis]PWN43794.1 hypothetical protein IE81DRAFT_321962 [Ceraceosorus guamensis]
MSSSTLAPPTADSSRSSNVNAASSGEDSLTSLRHRLRLNLPPSSAHAAPEEVKSFEMLSLEREGQKRKLRLGRMSFFKDALHLRSSVVFSVLPTLILLMLFAYLVAAANLRYGKQWTASSVIIGPLSVVFGLLIVFRNGTSYDRWFEGAKDWQNSLSDVRSLARFVWINCDLETLKGDDAKDWEERKRVHVQRKKEAIRLLALFLYATKHHLRAEHSLDQDDYEGLLSPGLKAAYERTLTRGSRLSTTFNSVSAPTTPRSSFLGRSRGGVTADSETAPLLLDDEEASSEPLSYQLLAASQGISLPHFVLLQFGKYLAKARRRGCFEDAGAPSFAMINTLLNQLTTSLGNQERVATMTIPVVYGIHLKQSTLLYLLALPFVLVSELSWRVVPFVGLVAFTLVGLEGIASEIERPFGKDPSDHPLDMSAALFRHEIEVMMRVEPGGIPEEDVL